MRVPKLIPSSHVVQCIRFRLPMEAGNKPRTDEHSLKPGAASDPQRSSRKGMKAVEFPPSAELIVNFNRC